MFVVSSDVMLTSRLFTHFGFDPSLHVHVHSPFRMRPCAAKHLFLPILNTLDRLRGALLILWVCIGKQMLIHSFMVLVLKLGIPTCSLVGGVRVALN